MIIFVHLLNDASGSPRVLKSVIEIAQKYDLRGKLYVGSGGTASPSDGVLSQTHIEHCRYPYRFKSFIVSRLLYFVTSQIILFAKLCLDKDVRHANIIWVNTLLPIGAMCFARLFKRYLVVHMHERELKPKLFHKVIVWITRNTASEVIFVSKEQQQFFESIRFKRSSVIHNTYDSALAQWVKAVPAPPLEDTFNLLMLASLKSFKGIPAFLELADRLADRPQFKLTLLINEDKAIGDAFREAESRPNLTIICRPPSTAPYYQAAHLVLNLSYPDEFIETFGLTLIEAMVFGVPVIAPPIGGPLEIVSHGQDGFLISARDLPRIESTILELADKPERYAEFRAAALKKATLFSPLTFEQKIIEKLTHEAY